MRTSLVGALLGARVGLSGIPHRFIEGLDGGEHLMELAEQIAEIALGKSSKDDTWIWPSEEQDK